MKEIDYYKPADKVIQLMNRENLRAFNRLKLADFDRVNVVLAVLELYREQARKAKKRYMEMGLEAYLLGLEMLDDPPPEREARRMAKEAITEDWVESLMNETDFVTLYRFNSEAERKAQRLIEGLAVVSGKANGKEPWQTPVDTRNMLIDQALKQWTKQLGQYAINVTDAAVIQALDDAGVAWVMWMTERDQRVCLDCHQLDGRIFAVDEVPAKPHMNCRCRLVPSENPEE